MRWVCGEVPCLPQPLTGMLPISTPCSGRRSPGLGWTGQSNQLRHAQDPRQATQPDLNLSAAFRDGGLLQLLTSDIARRSRHTPSPAYTDAESVGQARYCPRSFRRSPGSTAFSRPSLGLRKTSRTAFCQTSTDRSMTSNGRKESALSGIFCRSDWLFQTSTPIKTDSTSTGCSACLSYVSSGQFSSLPSKQIVLSSAAKRLE